MRVLFLDFDGVLHPLGLQVDETRFINGKPVAKSIEVDFFCWVPLLAELLAEHPDVGLVLHTSWRESHDDARLSAYLGPLQGRYLGKVADGDKWPAIEQWLAQQQQAVEFLVLDDAMQEFCDAPQNCYVETHFRRGLAEQCVTERIKDWLAATASKP